VVPGTWNTPAGSAPATSPRSRTHLHPSNAGVARMMIGAVDDWRKMGAVTVPDGGEWSDGAIALLGMPSTPCCRLPRKARAWRSRMRRCWQMPRRNREQRRHPAALNRYGRLRRARSAEFSARAAERHDLPSDRRGRAGPRPLHQVDGPAAHAGRGRTGFTTGGRETALAGASIDRAARRCGRRGFRNSWMAWVRAPARPRQAERNGIVGVPGFLGEPGLPAHRDVLVAIGEFCHHRTGHAGFGLRPSILQTSPRGRRVSRARSRAACSRRDRIAGSAKPCSCCRSYRRSRRAPGQARATSSPRRRTKGAGYGESERSCGFRKRTTFRLPKAAAGVGIEALRGPHAGLRKERAFLPHFHDPRKRAKYLIS